MTPASTSNELDVQNEREQNTYTQYNDGLLLGHYNTVDPMHMVLPSGKPFEYNVEVLSLHPMKQYIITTMLMMYYIVSVLFLIFVWCPFMTINVSV